MLASSGMDPTFIKLHEGTHYDEWLADPFAWHVDYGVQFAADWLYYANYDDAYAASPYEQRAHAVSSPNRVPTLLSPTPNPMRFIVEEVISSFGP